MSKKSIKCHYWLTVNQNIKLTLILANSKLKIVDVADFAIYGYTLDHFSDKVMPNPRLQFGWKSEAYDPLCSLIYMRSRYYQPLLKQFISVDPLMTGNNYGFVDGDPINNSDPSGYLNSGRIVSSLVSITISGIILALSNCIFPLNLTGAIGAGLVVRSILVGGISGFIGGMTGSLSEQLINKSTVRWWPDTLRTGLISAGTMSVFNLLNFSGLSYYVARQQTLMDTALETTHQIPKIVTSHKIIGIETAIMASISATATIIRDLTSAEHEIDWLNLGVNTLTAAALGAGMGYFQRNLLNKHFQKYKSSLIAKKLATLTGKERHALQQRGFVSVADSTRSLKISTAKLNELVDNATLALYYESSNMP